MGKVSDGRAKTDVEEIDDVSPGEHEDWVDGVALVVGSFEAHQLPRQERRRRWIHLEPSQTLKSTPQ